MLKQILNEKIKEQNSVQPSSVVLESKGKLSAIDPEIEGILPVIASREEEYDDYRFILKQLKARNPKAFNKIINLD